MSTLPPQSWYQNNVEEFKNRSDDLQIKYNNLSLLRLLVFVLFLALIGTSIYYRSGYMLAGVSLIFGIFFGKLINVHNRVKSKKLQYHLLMQINNDELRRLSLELHDFPDGSQYIHPGHSYCLDLDLFGTHSLFQWLNRTVTRGGERQLAGLMLEKSSVDEIAARQEAIKELSSSPQWNQEFLASGMAHKGGSTDIKAFLDWVNTISEVPKWYRIALLIMPAIAIGTTIIYGFGFLSGYLLLCVLAFNYWLLYRVKPKIEYTYNQTHKSIRTLRAYETMIAGIEDSDYESKLLRILRLTFVDKQERASVTINQLKNILSRIEVRGNMFYWILNPYFLLDFIWLIQARNWKLKHGDHVSHWFESLAEYEALVSLGLTAHSQSDTSYPSLVEDSYQFHAENLGHPLIPKNERILNHFGLEDKGTVVVLTGSNMSGKSTFLRTIGVNVVLARMGAPVCANSMTLGDFALFTSMRTTDSLEQHVSSFYAELERIRSLIQMLDQGTPTLYLLDELLKGTNSQDRNLGSSALIKQLRKGPAFGLISTHDLSLGILSEQFDNIINFSFNSDLRNGQLNFDYKLTKGLCKSFNASDLMAQMGINLESDHSDN